MRIYNGPLRSRAAHRSRWSRLSHPFRIPPIQPRLVVTSSYAPAHLIALPPPTRRSAHRSWRRSSLRLLWLRSLHSAGLRYRKAHHPARLRSAAPGSPTAFDAPVAGHCRPPPSPPTTRPARQAAAPRCARNLPNARPPRGPPPVGQPAAPSPPTAPLPGRAGLKCASSIWEGPTPPVSTP